MPSLMTGDHVPQPFSLQQCDCCPPLVARWLAISCWFHWGSAGLIVMLRRLMGGTHFTGDASRLISNSSGYFWLMFLATGMLLGANMLFLRSGVRTDSDSRASRVCRLIVTLGPLGSLAIGLQPATGWSFWGCTLLALILTAGGVWSPDPIDQVISHGWKTCREQVPTLLWGASTSEVRFSSDPATGKTDSRKAINDSESESLMAESGDIAHFAPQNFDPTFHSKWIRRKLPQGETIIGEFLVQLEAGQKQTSLHIPLVPPLQTTTGLICTGNGEGVDVQVGAFYTYGIRLDVRRSVALETFEGRVKYSVSPVY